MIITVSDLLKEVIEKEKEQFKEFGFISHGPTIGDMYEGLTKNILEQALFANLNIKVTSGFIRNEKGEISNEIDCMIVEGEGDTIPHTDKFVFPYSQVIAVLEIKKTLYKEELTDSYKKMYKLYRMSELELQSYNAFRDSFKMIVLKELPTYEEAKALPLNQNMIYHSLLVQNLMPLRIVFGYDGYKTEYSLRGAFVKYLEENLGFDGFSPVSFPDLIICGKNSLLKLNGMPYASPLDDDGYWHIYGSSSNNPLHVLLEFIWTKLSYKYTLPATIFGEDLEQDVVKPLLKTIAVNIEDKIGWSFNYTEITEEELSKAPLTVEWIPREITTEEAIIMHKLCEKEPLSLQDNFFREFDAHSEIYLEDVVGSLINKGLISRNNNEIYLLTDQCKVLTMNGKWYADDDKSGRLMRWVMKQQ